MSEHQAESTIQFPPQPAPLNCLIAALSAPESVNAGPPLLTPEEINYSIEDRYTRTPNLIAFAAMRHLGNPANIELVSLFRKHELDTALINSDGITLPPSIDSRQRKLAAAVLPFFSAYGYARGSAQEFRTKYQRPDGSMRALDIAEELYEGGMERVQHPLFDTFVEARKTLGDRAFEPERVLRYIMLKRLQENR